MESLWNLGKTQNSFCLELLFLKLCFVQSSLSSVSPGCFLALVCADEPRLLLLFGEAQHQSGCHPAWPLLPEGNCAQRLEKQKRGSADGLLLLPEPVVSAAAAAAHCSSWARGRSASICLQWNLRALLSPVCRVICKQAVSLGSRNVFFLNPKQIYSLVSCQIFAFSFSAPPSLWHTFSDFLCRSLLVPTPVHSLPSFPTRPKLWAL